MVQIDVVELIKVTANPDEEETVTIPVPPTATAGAAPKVIAWVP
jgi:hypothetical protein